MDKALEKFGIYIAITFSREAIQSRIDEFTNRMSDMLHIERDAELEFAKTTTTTNPVYSHKMESGEGKMYAVHTAISEKAERLFPIDPRQLEFTKEELNFVPAPDVNSEGQKPFEFLVSHVQPDQELGDTIYNLTAVSTSIGLGGMHLVLFKLEGNHGLPPTNLLPGNMVCVRKCDSRGAGATSLMQ